MSVDYTAFSCYGIAVSIPDDMDRDSFEAKLPAGLTLVEWGSRNYGGTGGFILADRATTAIVDFRSNASARRLAAAGVDAEGFRQMLTAARIAFGWQLSTHDEIGWFVGGYVS